MNKNDCKQLNRRLLQLVQSKTTDCCDQPMREQAEVFTCAERHSAEREQFFLSSPQLVGFAGQIAKPLDYLCTEVCGQPIVITRDADGEVHAFINACAHRGARVAEGCGNRKRLVCGFHGWAYDLNGQLAGQPKADCFASDVQSSQSCDLGLVPLAISERAGLLVVGPRPEVSQAEVDGYLDGIVDQLTGFGYAQMQHLETTSLSVKANWKLVAALSMESYHFACLHRNSVAEVLYDNAAVDFLGQHSRWAFPMKGIERLADVPEDDWPNMLQGVINHIFSPGTVLVQNPEDAQIIRVEPGAVPGESRVEFIGVCRHAEQVESAKAALAFGHQVFKEEDLPAAEACQQGMAARGGEFILGKNESVVQHWHREWRQRLKP